MASRTNVLEESRGFAWRFEDPCLHGLDWTDELQIVLLEPTTSAPCESDTSFRRLHFHAATVVAHVTAAIGPPVATGGMTVWFNVGQRLAAKTH